MDGRSVCEGRECEISGVWIKFAADSSEAFFEFEDESGVIAEFAQFEVEFECEVTGPKELLFAIAVGVDAAEVCDEMGEERGFEFLVGSGVFPLFGSGDEVSVAEPLGRACWGIDSVGAGFGVGGPGVFCSGPAADIEFGGAMDGGAPAFLPAGFEQCCGGAAVIVDGDLGVEECLGGLFALDLKGFGGGFAGVDIALSDTDGFAGESDETLDEIDMGFFRVFEDDDVVAAVFGNLFVDEDAVATEDGGVADGFAYAAVWTFGGFDAADESSGGRIDFFAGADCVVEPAAAAVDFFVAAEEGGSHGAGGDAEDVGFEGFDDEGENEKHGEEFNGLAEAFFAARSGGGGGGGWNGGGSVPWLVGGRRIHWDWGANGGWGGE